MLGITLSLGICGPALADTVGEIDHMQSGLGGQIVVDLLVGQGEVAGIQITGGIDSDYCTGGDGTGQFCIDHGFGANGHSR